MSDGPYLNNADLGPYSACIIKQSGEQWSLYDLIAALSKYFFILVLASCNMLEYGHRLCV